MSALGGCSQLYLGKPKRNPCRNKQMGYDVRILGFRKRQYDLKTHLGRYTTTRHILQLSGGAGRKAESQVSSCEAWLSTRYV
jgi:hypothetical protein